MAKVAGAGSLGVVRMAGSCSYGAVGSLLACSFAWFLLGLMTGPFWPTFLLKNGGRTR